MTRVFISSTRGALDPYRSAAVDVCRRHEMIPVFMEAFSPDPRPPAEVCRRNVLSCDVLLLLLGQRYGARPPDEALSYTELEYRWAFESKRIAILPFIARAGLLAEPEQDPDDASAQSAFIQLVQERHTAKFFSDLSGFRLDAYQALEPYRPLDESRRRYNQTLGGGSYYPQTRGLPSPPDLCAMPQYVGGTPFTGRDVELASLDEWARSDQPVMVVEAIGGTGKSALTWEWLRQRASHSIAKLAGSFWWSFYDGSASIERFLQELLAYVRACPTNDIIRSVDREQLAAQVLSELSRRPFLVVLDGFERLLVAYHRFDPSKVTDDDVDADHRENKHSIVDPLGYDFVRRLATASPSKILITTRMLPDALEGPSGNLVPGVVRRRLPGLTDADVLHLLERLGVQGTPERVQQFFGPLGNHPLLITLVAALVRDNREAPGFFDAWVQKHTFVTAEVNLAARKHHILAAAFADLAPETARLLGWMSALTGTVHWSVLEGINPFKDDGTTPARAGALLDAALRDLEVRGLVWWNRSANTYDMHPIVRAFAYQRMGDAERTGANTRFRDYFQALPPAPTAAASSVEDLQQTIMLFRALTGAGQYGQAVEVWSRRLADPLLVSLGANASVVELLEPYENMAESIMRGDLSIALHLAGRHERGVEVEMKILSYLVKRGGDPTEVRASLGRLAAHFRSIGLFAKYSKVVSLLSTNESRLDLPELLTLRLRKAVLDAICGSGDTALRILEELDDSRASGTNPWFRGDVRYWLLRVQYRLGHELSVNRIIESAREFPSWRSQLQLAQLRFEVLMASGRYNDALTVASDIDRLRRIGGQNVIPAESAMALAYVGRHSEAEAAAEECIVRMARLHEFDRPHQMLATTFAKIGDKKRAAIHAHAAYRRAWADGPAYSEQWGLRWATATLAFLGEVPPQMKSVSHDRQRLPHEDALRAILAR